MPWQLQVARFALPGLAIYATIMTYIDFAKVPLASLWAPRRRDHVIVAGDGARANDIAKRCLVDGLSLVAIQKDERTEVKSLRALGITVIVGSIDSPDTFVRAGIAGARAVALLSGSDSTNLRALISVDQAAKVNRPAGSAPLKIACDLQDRMMASVLSVALAEQRGGYVESHVIDSIDNVARQLVPRLPAQDTASLVADEVRRPCRILDLSLAGARITVDGPLPDEIVLDLPEVGQLPCRIVRRSAGLICVSFSGLGEDLIAGLVRSIYGAGRSNAVDHLEPAEVVRSLLVRFAA